MTLDMHLATMSLASRPPRLLIILFCKIPHFTYLFYYIYILYIYLYKTILINIIIINNNNKQCGNCETSY